MACFLQVTGLVVLATLFAKRKTNAPILVLAWTLLWSPGQASQNQTTEPPSAKPKPAKISISGYGLLGNRELKRILRTIELGGKKPEFFGPTFIEDAALILTARLKRDGYLEPTVLIQLRLDTGETVEFRAAELLEDPLPRPLRAKRVAFRIQKGVLYHYRDFTFQGLTAIDEKQARAYFMEGETLFRLKSTRVYTPERLRRGLSSLSDTLDREGFRDARVNGTVTYTNRQTGAVGVQVHVEEGRKYLVVSVREDYYYGDTNAPDSSRKVVLDEKPYSRLWLQDYTLGLKTNLFRQGFPDTSVEVKTLNELSDKGRVLVDLLAAVTSGPKVRIGEVQFSGHRRTRPALLSRRVRVDRGDLLNPILVEAGRYRLARLGVFESVELDYRPQDEHTRDVIYQLKEGRRLDLSLLFGYGSYELLRGGFEVDAINLWGLAHHAELRAIQSFKSSSGAFTYTIPEMVGKDVDVFFNASGLRREEVSFTRLEYGGGMGLHKYLPAAATDVSGRYNYQILSAQEYGTFTEIASEGLTNPAVGSVIFEIKHDRRDNPLYPRRGYKVFATLETAARVMGGDANFERIDLSTSWHVRLGGGRYLGLGVSHGVAVSFGSPADNLPFSRRFFPGGENSIRGYPEGEASPRNEDGDFVGAETFTLGTIELEQALTPRWSLVLFSDSLGYARRLENYPWDTGLFSVGAGIRWRTLIGPVRLEYGYNLNPRPEDPNGTVQFSLGFPF